MIEEKPNFLTFISIGKSNWSVFKTVRLSFYIKPGKIQEKPGKNFWFLLEKYISVCKMSKFRQSNV